MRARSLLDRRDDGERSARSCWWTRAAHRQVAPPAGGAPRARARHRAPAGRGMASGSPGRPATARSPCGPRASSRRPAPPTSARVHQVAEEAHCSFGVDLVGETWEWSCSHHTVAPCALGRRRCSSRRGMISTKLQDGSGNRAGARGCRSQASLQAPGEPAGRRCRSLRRRRVARV